MTDDDNDPVEIEQLKRQRRVHEKINDAYDSMNDGFPEEAVDLYDDAIVDVVEGAGNGGTAGDAGFHEGRLRKHGENLGRDYEESWQEAERRLRENK